MAANPDKAMQAYTQKTNPEKAEILYKKQFIARYLQRTQKLDAAAAAIMSGILHDRRKPVADGDMAILEANDGHNSVFYERRKSQWIVSSKNSMGATDADALCNMQEECMSTVKGCASIDATQHQVLERSKAMIVSEYEHKTAISRVSLEKSLTRKYDRALEVLPRLIRLSASPQQRASDVQYAIGQAASANIDVVVSPHARLLVLILGQADFIKKQTDILRFKDMYCVESESDPWWYFCHETKVKLLPKSVVDLAVAFTEGRYLEEMDRQIKAVGAQSDDGDCWVDKHSGYVLKRIEDSTDEGYDEGFKVKTRDILEVDFGEAILEGIKNKNKDISAETQAIHNVLNALEAAMSLPLTTEAFSEFVERTAMEIFVKRKPTRDAYERAAAAAKKKQAPASYADAINKLLLYTTLGVTLVAIQSNVPSMKTKKTFSGCVKSFKGYPMSGAGDDSALTYMCCIVRQMRAQTVEPWNVVDKKVENIVAMMRSTIDGTVMPNTAVQARIKDKLEYLAANPEPEIPEDHAIERWREFLPPLTAEFRVDAITPISQEFVAAMKRDIGAGSDRQRDSVLVLESKQRAFSLAIQASIQTIVAAKQKLLVNGLGQPFVSNVCCNNRSSTAAVLEYFVEQDESIRLHNGMSVHTQKLLDDVLALTDGTYLFCRLDSKNKYPAMVAGYSEETIYTALSAFCQFRTLKPIPAALMPICKAKPDFNVRGYSIQETIDKLKAAGVVVTDTSFIKLCQLVGAENKIHVVSGSLVPTETVTKPGERLQAVIKDDDGFQDKKLRDLLIGVLDTFSIGGLTVDTTETRALKNYLGATLAQKRATLIQFLVQNNTTGKKQTFIAGRVNAALGAWTAEIKANVTDEHTDNAIRFFQGYARQLVRVWPSMIENEVEYKPGKSKHWKLSDIHTGNVQQLMEQASAKLKPFFGRIPNISSIPTVCAQFRAVADSTPYWVAVGERFSVFDRMTAMMLEEWCVMSIFEAYTTLHEDLDENKGAIADLLLMYMASMLEHRRIIDKDVSEVMNKVFLSKELEKNLITDRLKKMTDEARRADNIFKSLKLGEVWGKGLQAGLRKYNKISYDEDREFIKQLNPEEPVDPYVEEEDRENADIGGMGEDYADGTFDASAGQDDQYDDDANDQYE
jgi:hypothetical protein